jgi:hypothetical protein
MPNDPIIIGIAVLAIAVLGYTAINGMMSGTKSKSPLTSGGLGSVSGFGTLYSCASWHGVSGLVLPFGGIPKCLLFC